MLTDNARSLGRGAIDDEEVTCGGPIQRELWSDMFSPDDVGTLCFLILFR